MINRLIPVTMLGALMLSACQDNAADTAEKVAEARDAAAGEVADARQDASETLADANAQISDAQHDYATSERNATRKLTRAQSEAMVKTAHADFELESAEAQGRNDVATAKCDALDGVDRTACLSSAAAIHAASQADATATRDAALVSAGHLE